MILQHSQNSSIAFQVFLTSQTASIYVNDMPQSQRPNGRASRLPKLVYMRQPASLSLTHIHHTTNSTTVH